MVRRALAKAAESHFNGGVVLPTFTTVVHVGQSFDTAITHTLQAQYPELSDGAIQTGWLVNEHFDAFGQAAFGFQYAAEDDPKNFGDRGSWYVIPGAKNSFQQLSLAKALLDPRMLVYGTSIKQPGIVGESIPELIIGLPATNLAGPQTGMSFFTCMQYFICRFLLGDKQW